MESREFEEGEDLVITVKGVRGINGLRTLKGARKGDSLRKGKDSRGMTGFEKSENTTALCNINLITQREVFLCLKGTGVRRRWRAQGLRIEKIL
jgi:hypothetical protein